jgi:hypothetical protein
MNMRERTKRARMEKIQKIIEKAKADNLVIDKPRLISMIMVEHGVSKKTAQEEVEAVMLYNE